MRSNATKILSSILMAALILFIAIDAVLLLSSPFWLKVLYAGPVDVTRGGETSISIFMPTGTEPFILVFVILSGLVLGAIMLEAIRLLRSAQKGTPFCIKNARSLKHCAWFCLAQMVLFAAKMVNGPTALTLGCAGIFLLASMLFFVLADLFHSAALLREDNDLTI